MQTVLISSPLVLLFLGFCALVVVFQLIPALTTIVGMVRGLASDTKSVEVK